MSKGRHSFDANGPPSLSRMDSILSTTSLRSIEINDEFIGAISPDLLESSLNNNYQDALPKLSEEKMSLEDMVKAGQEAFNVFINNQYMEGYFMLDRHCKTSFYHSFGKCLILSVRFGFSLKAEYYQSAWDACMEAISMINKSRKVRSTASKATSMLFKSDYSDWTDENCHAELCFAEISAVHASLLIANDRSITGFVRAAMRLRTCYYTYRECKSILKNKTNWTSREMRDHFESGVLLGLGLFDLGVSYFPSKMIKLLEIAGFSGNRSAGMAQIMSCAKITHGLRYPVVSLVLSGYYGFADFFYGLGEPDVEVIFSILDHWLPIAPNSIAVQMGLAFKATWEGKFSEACKYYDEYEQGQNFMKAITYASVWQKMWIHAVQLNWPAAVENSRYLAENCKWSPSMIYYVHACLLSMVVEDCYSKDEIEKARELKREMAHAFKQAVTLKRTFGGRRAFHEKLVSEKARSFLKNPTKIVLIPLDLMYMWNIFIVASKNNESLPAMLGMIEEKLQLFPPQVSTEVNAYLTFMRGVCYEFSNCPLLAVEAFYQIIDLENQLEEEKHLVPQAYFEIGQIYRRSGDWDQAKRWYKKAKSYNDYLTDGLIRFRIDAALRCMKEQASK